MTECEKVAKKRKPAQILQPRRSVPQRRWRAWEEEELLDFIKKNPNFEKPISEVYYNKFIRNSKIEGLNFKLVRHKVRNMRTKYEREKIYLSDMQDKVMLRKGETMQEFIARKYPSYDKMHQIFGNKDFSRKAPYRIDVEESMDNEDQDEKAVPAFEHVYNDEQHSLDIIHVLPEDEDTSSNTFEQITNKQELQDLQDMKALENYFTFCEDSESEEEQNFHRHNAIEATIPPELPEVSNEIEDLQNQKFQLEKQRFEFEKLKFEKETHLKERELSMKRWEIKTNAKLKEMELKMKERIALKEIEMRIKLNMFRQD